MTMILIRNRKDATCSLLGALLAAAVATTGPARAASGLLSPAEAQQQVRFPIAAPSQIPPGAKLEGVRVFAVNAQPRPSGLSVRRKPIKQGGYGVHVYFRGGQFRIEAYPGGPAEKDGLPSSSPSELLAVNGHAITIAEQSKLAALPPRQRFNPHTPTLANLLNARPPLKLRIADSNGKPRTVVLVHEGGWYLQTGRALQMPFHPQMRAALYYIVQGRPVMIAETEIPNSSASHVASFQPSLPGSHKKTIGGVEVTFYGPEAAPNATFRRKGVEFDIYNFQKSLTAQDEEAMIASM